MNGGGEGNFGFSMGRGLERMQDASYLLATAEGLPEASEQRLLAGCSVVLLAVALEEELALSIRPRLDGGPAGLGEGLVTADLERLEKLPLELRIEGAVRTLSRGRVELRKREDSSEVASLLALPGWRNALLHEGPGFFSELVLDSDGWHVLSPEGDRKPFEVPRLRDPWREVSPAMARRFRTVVEAYISELQEIDVDEDDGEFEGGLMTKRLRR